MSDGLRDDRRSHARRRSKSASNPSNCTETNQPTEHSPQAVRTSFSSKRRWKPDRSSASKILRCAARIESNERTIEDRTLNVSVFTTDLRGQPVEHLPLRPLRPIALGEAGQQIYVNASSSLGNGSSRSTRSAFTSSRSDMGLSEANLSRK
jgi:hypothetical protein